MVLFAELGKVTQKVNICFKSLVGTLHKNSLLIKVGVFDLEMFDHFECFPFLSKNR